MAAQQRGMWTDEIYIYVYYVFVQSYASYIIFELYYRPKSSQASCSCIHSVDKNIEEGLTSYKLVIDWEL